MQMWVETLEKHPINATISKVESQLEEIENLDIPLEHLGRFSRIRTFIITLKSYIAETDPSIIHFGGLSQINQQLSGLVDQLNN